jgi:endonuclease YncB( thermonuclease family)
MSAEVLAWLRAYLVGRPVRVALHKRDQYDRVVATVYVRGPLGLLRRRDVGLEMLQRGFATVYEAKTGAEFGGREATYRAAEARAKARGRGVWAKRVQEAGWESPREYKTRIRAEEADAGASAQKDTSDSNNNSKKRWWFW